MKIINEKKIHNVIMCIGVAIALGYSSFFSIRGILAYEGTSRLGFAFNDIISFVVTSILMGLIYEFVSTLLFRSNIKIFGANKINNMQYALRFFVIPAGVLSGIIKTLYLFFPITFLFGETFIEFVCLLIFITAYIAYVCKNYFQKEEYSNVTLRIGIIFLGIYAMMVAFSILSGVLL